MKEENGERVWTKRGKGGIIGGEKQVFAFCAAGWRATTRRDKSQTPHKRANTVRPYDIARNFFRTNIPTRLPRVGCRGRSRRERPGALLGHFLPRSKKCHKNKQSDQRATKERSMIVRRSKQQKSFARPLPAQTPRRGYPASATEGGPQGERLGALSWFVLCRAAKNEHKKTNPLSASRRLAV